MLAQLLDHLDGLVSTVLCGVIGIGKTTIALTLLHHARMEAKFGPNRYFIRCDDPINSLTSFLEHLSDTIGIHPTRDMEQLQPQLTRLPPLLLVVDGVDYILDPLAADSKEISVVLEEMCRHQKICLLSTSRMAIDIPGLHTVEVTTPSEDGARDIFYGLCHLGRSPAIDDLLVSLDFHPLSLSLLARAAYENGWDESGLLREWKDGETDAIKTVNCESLETAIESVLASPTIRKLGSTAYETLEAIAVFPNGVKENLVGRAFPHIPGMADAIDILYKFYLVVRQGGFIKLLSPFRLYFLQRISIVTYVRGEEGTHSHPNDEDENPIRCNLARGGLSPNLFDGWGLTHFEVPPVYTAGPKVVRRNPATPRNATMTIGERRRNREHVIINQYVPSECLPVLLSINCRFGAGLFFDLDDDPVEDAPSAPVVNPPSQPAVTPYEV